MFRVKIIHKKRRDLIIFITLILLFIGFNLIFVNSSEALLLSGQDRIFSDNLGILSPVAMEGEQHQSPVLGLHMTPASTGEIMMPEFFRQPLTNIGVLNKVMEAVTNYFVEARCPDTGLFVDAGSAEALKADLGIAATGYGLTAITMAAAWGLIPEDQARRWVNQALRTLIEIQDKQFEYEKELNSFLEEIAQREGIVLEGLSDKERFNELEELRYAHEIEFLLNTRWGPSRREYERELALYARDEGKDIEEVRGEFETRFLREHSNIYKYGRWGFFYRYMDRETQERIVVGLNDLSSVDSAIGYYGVLVAGKHFGGETERLSRKLYERVNWQRMLNPGQHRDKPGIFSMGWIPELVFGRPDIEEPGFLPWDWEIYTDEVFLLNLLAIGSPTYGVCGSVYEAFERLRGSVGGMPEFVLTPEGGLWASNTASIFADVLSRVDGDEVNWFQNGLMAALANRNIVLNMEDDEGKTLAERYDTFDAHLWPITTMLTPMMGRYGGYRMDIGVVRPRLTRFDLRNPEKTPPLVAPNGFGGSIIHSLFSFLGLRYLASTLDGIWWRETGFADSFTKDGEVFGVEDIWIAPTQIGFSQGQFLQIFNLLGELAGARGPSIWDITNEIDYIQTAFEKAGFEEICFSDSIPDELFDGMREDVAGEIDDLEVLIDTQDNKLILEAFDNLIDNYLTEDGAMIGEYDELVRVLNGKVGTHPFNPVLHYMIAETRLAQIRNISIAATGEKYVNPGDYYKTFEAIKSYFENADRYYWEAMAHIRVALANLHTPDDVFSYNLKIRATAIEFVITKNTFSDYEGQIKLFEEIQRLIAENPYGFDDGFTRDLASMIYRYDWEGELTGALTLEGVSVYDELMGNYLPQFNYSRTARYPLLERRRR